MIDKVHTRCLSDFSDLQAVVELFSGVWGRKENPPVTIELLRAFAKAGSYIGGAFDDDTLVGAAVAFPSAEHSALHSHIAGVSKDARGHNTGFALKLHQREWALERSFSEIVWTFDPLVSRNAYFNLVKLAAEPVEYLTNFYGGMSDDINGGDETDRLVVRWVLESPAVVEACEGRTAHADVESFRASGASDALTISPEGRPVISDTGQRTALVAIPRDIESLRSTDPALARQWRLALRSVLGGRLDSGATVTGFDRDSWYILQSTSDSVSPQERISS